MTHRMLLHHDGDDGTGTTDPRPTVDDETLMSMRPNGRCIATYTIALDGSGDFTTLEDAITAGKDAQNAKMNAEGQTALTPNYRVDYLVKPGTYPRNDDGMPSLPPFCGFYATDTTRGSTKVMSGFTTSGATYWEGIDVTNTDNTSGVAGAKYCFHVENHYTEIFARCTMLNDSTDSGGSGWPIGMDGKNGGTCLLYDCTLTDNLDGTGITNMHGDLSYEAGPAMTMMYVNCTYADGQINYHSLIDAQADQVWIVGCTASSFLVGEAATAAHFSGNTPDTFTHATIDGTQTATDDTRSDWPVPTGGLSATDRAHFGM